MKGNTKAFVVLVFVMIVFGGCQKEPSYQGKTLGQWVQETKTNDQNIRNQAFYAIRSMGPNTIPLLIEMLKKAKNEDDRIAVTDTLGKIGPTALPYIIKTIKDNKDAKMEDDDTSLSFWTELILMNIASVYPAKEVTPSIIELIKDDDIKTRRFFIAGAIAYAYGVGKQFIPTDFQELIQILDIDNYKELTSIQKGAKRDQIEKEYETKYKDHYFMIYKGLVNNVAKTILSDEYYIEIDLGNDNYVDVFPRKTMIDELKSISKNSYITIIGKFTYHGTGLLVKHEMRDAIIVDY